jgi:CYTH domain-containing protein
VATEIERKWVADQPPPVETLGAGTPLRQGYVAIDGDVTVRVRIAPDRAWLTIKGGGDALGRTEVEVALDLAEAEDLWKHTSSRRIDKTRHRLPVGDRTAEVDVFAGSLAGLCLVEVEFPSVEAANAFDPPAWFGREVTGLAEWSNASLARHGRPAT